jgi:hypothetical protein
MAMNRRLTAVLFAFVAVISALFLLWPSDETRIRKLFKEGAAALEAGDIDKVMGKISFNYRDDYGMTYLTLRETLKREFQRLSDIGVEYGDLNVRVEDATALAEVALRVVATSGNETGYIVGDIRTPLPLRFTLERERTKWLVVKAEGFGDQRMRNPAR